MLNLLNLFTSTSGEASGDGSGSSWVTLIVFGVLIVGMVLMMIIPQRKQKKRAEEMMAKLAIGSVITSIGGIVGTVVALDDKFIWIETGVDGAKGTMQLLRQAIHSIDSADAQAVSSNDAAEVDETDEIK